MVGAKPPLTLYAFVAYIGTALLSLLLVLGVDVECVRCYLHTNSVYLNVFVAIKLTNVS